MGENEQGGWKTRRRGKEGWMDSQLLATNVKERRGGINERQKGIRREVRVYGSLKGGKERSREWKA